MIRTLLLIAVILLVAWILRLKLRSDSAKALTTGALHAWRNNDATREAHRYAAVSVHTAQGSCHPAQQIKGVRYLSDEAPALPLANCPMAKCHCTYIHHTDRRTGTLSRRRRVDDELVMARQEDRRESWGRRANDLAPA